MIVIEPQIADLSDIRGVSIGQVEDGAARTGVTVFLCPEGAPCGFDVRGGGPATRETRVLDPLAAAEVVHGVVLAGGSAYGLAAAGGVMRFLEERGYGFPVGDFRVPLVCQADIFDLFVGDGSVRPDEAMGYAACVAALSGRGGNFCEGAVGAGCGATVGKLRGPEFARPSGISSYALRTGDLLVAAVVVVNAVGDVYDPAAGAAGAGDARGADAAGAPVTGEVGDSVAPTKDESGSDVASAAFASNTTIGCILTNAELSKAQLCKVAAMGHDGIARAIRPVHTSMDGDALFALSVGEDRVRYSCDDVGTLAAECVTQAILRAVR